jgi:LmbE family N-acetylglucosaminyl deacetylase
VLVVAPHPDDEVLGVGGSIARHSAQGDEVFVAIVTRADAGRFPSGLVEVGRREAAAAHGILGVHETHYLDFPAAELDQVPHADVNAALGRTFDAVRPEVVYTPFVGDIHLDHQRIALSTLVCSRPVGRHYPRSVLAYETLSETNWNAPYLSPAFAPNVFSDISEFLDLKSEALQCFASQVRQFPDERSVRAVRALGRLRGAQVSLNAAEAFVLLRHVR